MILVDKISSEVEALVLAVHRRNKGHLSELNWNWRLLEPALEIDSLDLAEIVAGVEKRFSVSLFESSVPPRTWNDVLRVVNHAEGSSEHSES